MWLWIVAGCGQPAALPAGEMCDESGIDGAELFARTWVPHDPRSPQGDGLGPAYNDVSCVACHMQGGPGGAGPNDKNVILQLTADGRSEVRHRKSGLSVREEQRASTGLLERIVMKGPGPTTLARSTPALFGAGQIDAIPDAVLLVAEAVGVPDAPWIDGRVARDPDGRPARFGWKGQIATLAGFVEGACANELGLQTVTVDQPGPKGSGVDMDDEMLVAMVAHVSRLASPERVFVPGAETGETLFTTIGCAGCHQPTLGDVQGLYSDLLLHDLGDGLADSASGYGGAVEARPDHDLAAKAGEWRTPPLWGLRDSAPYLHDGRARTVADAVAWHHGEAWVSRQAFFALSTEDRVRMDAFLGSLVAPRPERLASR